MIGGHFIKGWSRTQNHVTMSSAEAELVALVKCSAELLGVRSMLRDFGVETSGVVYADSSAALAIAKRKGAGKLRHINVSSLWVQEKQDRKDLEYRKVLGTDNPADMMTKHLLREPLDKCMGQLNQWRRSGRAKIALDIQGKGKGEAAQEEGGQVVRGLKRLAERGACAGGVRAARVRHRTEFRWEGQEDLRTSRNSTSGLTGA